MDGETATVGISEHAQSELGDITYLELPDPGTEIVAGDPLGIIESVKAATDIYAPVTGEVLERNETAVDSPEIVNSSPYVDAWLLKVKLADMDQVAGLMDASAYDAYLEDEGK